MQRNHARSLPFRRQSQPFEAERRQHVSSPSATNSHILSFSKVYPTGDQWDTLSNLSSRLSEAAKTVQEEIRVLLESRSDRAWKESEEHRSKAQSCRGDLFAKGRLKQPAVFRRNIVTIFKGPKTSTFDSEDIKFKNESTLKRCELIRGLSPDGVISWAMAFAPTLWAGGSISADIFTCLLDDIEPELVQTWPQVIRDTLHKLMEDEESLKKSPEYQEFLQALDDQSRKPVKNRKWRRTEDEIEQVKSATEDVLSPSNESREMKYMYTNAPASNISNLPEPFRTAVENSRLWKWERSQELVTTGCLASLLPKDYTQDVSFTIWCGHDNSYQLNDIFGVQRAILSYD